MFEASANRSVGRPKWFFSALADTRGGNYGVVMKDGIRHAFGLVIALAAGFLVTSCGRDTIGPRPAALRAAVVSSIDPTGFTLQKPNTAMIPNTGETISTTGAGSFGAGSIVASGSFTQLNAGSVVASGHWAATAFQRFQGFGGPNPGEQGGQLTFTATLFPDGGSPVTGVTVVVTCLIFAPPGFGEEGTSVGAYTEHTGGTTLFHNE